jgi:Rrf2 family transcriptional regulator, iron-sulfur cluster assembly transcription factor
VHARSREGFNGAVIVSMTAEYALRAMAQIAALGSDGALRAKDLSALAHVPAPYLSKILHRLVAAGLLESEKGHGGGFRLTRPPSKISFHDIFLALGEELESDRCAFGWGACDKKHPCLLHPAISELNTQFGRWSKRSTLAMVAARLPHQAARGKL